MRNVLWGLGFLVLLAGCSGVTTLGTGGTGGTGAPKEEEPTAPHGGKLFATEDKVHHHIELVAESGKPGVIYLYDKTLKKSISTGEATIKLTVKGEPPTVITFKADRQATDPANEASVFKSEKPLPDKLDWKQAEFTAKIKGADLIFKLDDD